MPRQCVVSEHLSVAESRCDCERDQVIVGGLTLRIARQRLFNADSFRIDKQQVTRRRNVGFDRGQVTLREILDLIKYRMNPN